MQIKAKTASKTSKTKMKPTLNQADLDLLDQRFANKDDLKIYATKDDLKQLTAKFATKEDLKMYASKEDMLSGFDAVMAELKLIREELIVINYQMREHSDCLENHETRIDVIEKKIDFPVFK